LRIAIVTPVYQLPGDPTRGRYIYEIARCLGTLATIEVFFVTARYPQFRWLRPRTYVYSDLDADLSTPDVDVSVSSYASIPVLSRLLNGYSSAHAMFGGLARFRPDVVLGYWLYPEGYGAWLCAKKLQVPCVLGGLGTDVRARGRLTRWLSGRALRGAQQLIMVSEEMRRLTIERFGVEPARVHAIANGVNSGVFYPRSRAAAREKLGVPATARVIVYVGRFVATKGLRELLEAFASMADHDADLRLVMVGDGVMREELRARLSAPGWADRVELPGALAPPEVAEWISAANVLCLPSYSEGYPNVVVESLACGRPVVATNVGGILELVNAANGRLVPPRDVAALRAALADALNRGWDEEAIAAAWSRSWHDVAVATLDVCRRAQSAALQPESER
jgi:glycosyltransferase involved in cell wall biosynthesis